MKQTKESKGQVLPYDLPNLRNRNEAAVATITP